MLKNFENLFRVAFLLVLVAALVIAAWHLSWLHRQDRRYEMITPTGVIRVHDREQNTFYELTYDGIAEEGKPEPSRTWKQLPTIPR